MEENNVSFSCPYILSIYNSLLLKYVSALLSSCQLGKRRLFLKTIKKIYVFL